MRFTTFLSIGIFACYVAASPAVHEHIGLQKRIVMGQPEINSTFTKIIKSIDKEVDTLNHWDESEAGVGPIIEDSRALLAQIKSAKEIIAKSSALGTFDLPNLLGSVGYLALSLGDVVTTLNNKKEKFDKVGKTVAIREQLVAQRNAAEELTKVILSKLPSWTLEMARPVTDGFVHKLDGAIDIYNLPAKPAKI